MNKKPKFVIKNENKCVVGAYSVTFGHRSFYIYKVSNTYASGFFIRKQPWLEILAEKPEISKRLK